MDRLPNQRLSRHLSSIESVHLLFQLPSFLLQSLLFLLVHPLELLKPLMELEAGKDVRQTKLSGTFPRASVRNFPPHLLLLLFQLGLRLLHFVDKHLSHFLLFALQISKELLPLGFIRFLEAGDQVGSNGHDSDVYTKGTKGQWTHIITMYSINGVFVYLYNDTM